MTWRPDIVIYHGGCNDGFGAAWACHKKWGYGTQHDDGDHGNIEYVPMGYSDKLPDIAGKNVLFVDFSLKRDAMIAASKEAKSIVVLDHHKTAEAELDEWIQLSNVENNFESIGEFIYDGQIMAFFDMQKSGARLAWEFCFPGTEPPALIQYVEDRDLWRFTFNSTHAYTKALSAYPQTFEQWTLIAEDSAVDIVNEGEAIARYHDKMVKDACANAYEVEIGGHIAIAVNVPYFLGSDCAHELLQRDKIRVYPFAAYWLKRGDGAVQWGLRSEDSRMDVSEIAKKLGGGGHRNAAGFMVPGC